MLINIQEEGDVNDVPQVGQHDNYTGSAKYVMPGTGGGGVGSFMESGYGGFAGFVNLPPQALDIVRNYVNKKSICSTNVISSSRI
ncbi:MAG: hypothetical protein HC877_23250 [Thioploca sp.]|nr:hypothetical protein [Thioploca sp.]